MFQEKWFRNKPSAVCKIQSKEKGAFKMSEEQVMMVVVISLLLGGISTMFGADFFMPITFTSMICIGMIWWAKDKNKKELKK